MTVLSENIDEKSSNNFHYLQMAMLDLKKYGYEHPKHDLSFVIDYAEATHKRSQDNRMRFLELVEICKKYPQTLWPYKTTRDEYGNEEAEYEEDYSEFVTKKPSENDSKEQTEEDDDFGMIQYNSFSDRVYAVAIEGDRVGAEISLKPFADIFRFRGSGILTITGIPGHGKAQPLDCLIQTPTGSVKMSDIRVGDKVLTKNGTTKVVGVYPQGKKNVYKITFSDHSSTKCCAEHLWEVIDTTKKYQTEVIQLSQMIGNLTHGKYPWVGSRYKIPTLVSNFDSQKVP